MAVVKVSCCGLFGDFTYRLVFCLRVSLTLSSLAAAQSFYGGFCVLVKLLDSRKVFVGSGVHLNF